MRQLLCSVATIFLTLAGPAHAVTLVNGSMTHTGGNYNTFNILVPAGWSNQGLNSPDIFDANTDFGSFAWSSSVDGGTFVHALASGSSDEGIFQTISGLAIGQAYAITFEQSISNRSGFNRAGDEGLWKVTFGSTTLASSSMVTPTLGVAYLWESQTLRFTATSTTQDLIFIADQTSGDPAIRVDLGLDGVSIALVPEAGFEGMALAGFAILLGVGLHHKPHAIGRPSTGSKRSQRSV